MSDAIEFAKETNIVSKLSSDQKQVIASTYCADRWRNTRDLDIDKLIQDSQEAWDFMLNNIANSGDIGAAPSVVDRVAVVKEKMSRKLRLGQIPEVVFTLASLQHSSMFPADDRFFRGTPQNEDAKENREKYEAYLSSCMGEFNADYNFYLHRLNTIVDGTAVAAVHYKKESRKKKVYRKKVLQIPEFLGGGAIDLPGLDVTTKEVVDKEGTEVCPLNFNDWVADPYASSFKDAWFIRRWYAPTWKVERDFKLKKGSVTTHSRALEDHSNDKDVIGENLKGKTSATSNVAEPAGKTQALLRVVYDDFSIDGVMYENHVAVVVNDKDVVWFGKNEYAHGMKPYVMSQYYPMPNMLYGLSAIKHVIPVAEAIDDFVDITLEAGRLGTKPTLLVNIKEEIFDTGSFPFEAGMVYPVKDIGNAAMPVQLPLPNIQYVQFMIEYLKKFIEDHTGASPAFSGQQPDGTDTTAFQVSQHVQSGSTKFMTLVRNEQNTTIEPFLKMVHENNQQFMSEPKYVIGYDDPLTIDDVRLMEFKWTMTSVSASQNMNQKLQQNMMLLQNLIPQSVKEGWGRIKPGIVTWDVGLLIKDTMDTSRYENASEIAKFETEEEMMLEQQNEQGGPPIGAGPPVGESGLPVDNGGGIAGGLYNNQDVGRDPAAGLPA